jgi:hypothetical protein
MIFFRSDYYCVYFENNIASLSSLGYFVILFGNK